MGVDVSLSIVRSILARSVPLACLGPLLAAACHRPTPPVDPHAPGASFSPAASERAAFVVLTADETLVVPTDPALATKTLPGHWVGALPVLPPAAWGLVPVELTLRHDPGLPSLPACPSGEFSDPCSLVVDTLATDRRAALASAEGMVLAEVEVAAGQAPRARLVDTHRAQACTCVVVHGVSTDGPLLDLDDPGIQHDIETSPHTPEEYVQICGLELEPELEPTAYVGGVLYSNGYYHNGMCNGLNLYESASVAEPLRPGATAPTPTFPRPVGCQLGTALARLDLSTLETSGFACEPQGDLLAYALRRGRLVRSFGSTNAIEDSDCSCASWMQVSAALCPSPLDPCGVGRELATREAWKELWVTTDEHLALGQDAEGIAVLASDRPTPIRRAPITDRILGVEYHATTALLDVEPPPSEVRVEIPARAAADASFVGSAAKWGNRCFTHLEAERLDAAEAACIAGLLEGGSDGTRGALTYNLGRIAEARGERETARRYYERSQRLRPHEATAERLRALGGP